MIWTFLKGRAEILKNFCSFFGRNDDIINSFWNLLTFSCWCCIDRSGLAMASSSSLKTNVKWSRSSLARGWLFWLLNWFANSEMTAASSVAKLKSLLSIFFLDCSLQSFLWLKNSAMSANVVRHLPQRCKSSSWSSSEVESSSSVNVIPDM